LGKFAKGPSKPKDPLRAFERDKRTFGQNRQQDWALCNPLTTLGGNISKGIKWGRAPPGRERKREEKQEINTLLNGSVKGQGTFKGSKR